MSKLVTGHHIAAALIGIRMMGDKHPMFTFEATHGSAAQIRRVGNQWLKDNGFTSSKLTVARTFPFSGQTHTKTDWECRLVRTGEAA